MFSRFKFIRRFSTNESISALSDSQRDQVQIMINTLHKFLPTWPGIFTMCIGVGGGVIGFVNHEANTIKNDLKDMIKEIKTDAKRLEDKIDSIQIKLAEKK